MDFSIFSEFCNHHYNLVENFTTSKRNRVPIASHSSFLPAYPHVM